MMMMMTANQDFTMKKKILLNKMLGRKTCFFQASFPIIIIRNRNKKYTKRMRHTKKKNEERFQSFRGLFVPSNHHYHRSIKVCRGKNQRNKKKQSGISGNIYPVKNPTKKTAKLLRLLHSMQQRKKQNSPSLNVAV